MRGGYYNYMHAPGHDYNAYAFQERIPEYTAEKNDDQSNIHINTATGKARSTDSWVDLTMEKPRFSRV
jgi:hypothetical protein